MTPTSSPREQVLGQIPLAPDFLVLGLRCAPLCPPWCLLQPGGRAKCLSRAPQRALSRTQQRQASGLTGQHPRSLLRSSLVPRTSRGTSAQTPRGAGVLQEDSSRLWLALGTAPEPRSLTRPIPSKRQQGAGPCAASGKRAEAPQITVAGAPRAPSLFLPWQAAPQACLVSHRPAVGRACHPRPGPPEPGLRAGPLRRSASQRTRLSAGQKARVPATGSGTQRPTRASSLSLPFGLRWTKFSAFENRVRTLGPGESGVTALSGALSDLASGATAELTAELRWRVAPRWTGGPASLTLTGSGDRHPSTPWGAGQAGEPAGRAQGFQGGCFFGRSGSRLGGAALIPPAAGPQVHLPNAAPCSRSPQRRPPALGATWTLCQGCSQQPCQRPGAPSLRAPTSKPWAEFLGGRNLTETP